MIDVPGPSQVSSFLRSQPFRIGQESPWKGHWEGPGGRSQVDVSSGAADGPSTLL